MKYLILKPRTYNSGLYELEEFKNPAEAGKYIAQNGLGDYIVAKRMDVEISICEIPSAQDDF